MSYVSSACCNLTLCEWRNSQHFVGSLPLSSSSTKVCSCILCLTAKLAQWEEASPLLGEWAPHVQMHVRFITFVKWVPHLINGEPHHWFLLIGCYSIARQENFAPMWSMDVDCRNAGAFRAHLMVGLGTYMWIILMLLGLNPFCISGGRVESIHPFVLGHWNKT